MTVHMYVNILCKFNLWCVCKFNLRGREATEWFHQMLMMAVRVILYEME